MTEVDLVAWGADLANRFNALIPANDADADMRIGSALFAHEGTASAARQLQRLARLEPSLILEIGTGKGITTVMLSRIARCVITVDLGPYPLRQEVWGWAKCDNIAQVFVPDDSHKGRLLEHLDFDVAFVDGDHSVDGCAFDFQYVKRCGAVLFHDFTPPYPNGPLALLKTLPAELLIQDPPFLWWVADDQIMAQLTNGGQE